MELNVQKLYDDGSLNNVTIECTFNGKLEQLIKDLKPFGNIEVNKYEKHASFSWKGDKSAQIFKSMSGDKSMGNINARLVLESYKNTMLKYGPKGEFYSKSRITSGKYNIGYGLAMVDSKTVAVSSGGNNPKHLYLIDTNSTETRQVLNLGDWCYGLNCHKGTFICCTSDNGITLYDSVGQNLTYKRTLSNAPKLVDGTYVTSNEIAIFHSNFRDNSVVCYDFSGHVQWKYSDSLLKKPFDITLDSYFNIYVAGSDSNNVVVISKDGKQAKQLVGESDGVLNPRAVFFHKTKNVLLVANYDGVALLFDV